MILFIVTTNYDYVENIEMHRTRAAALNSIACIFGCGCEHDTLEFWEELRDQYSVGKWKGFQFVSVDTMTMETTSESKWD